MTVHLEMELKTMILIYGVLFGNLVIVQQPVPVLAIPVQVSLTLLWLWRWMLKSLRTSVSQWSHQRKIHCCGRNATSTVFPFWLDWHRLSSLHRPAVYKVSGSSAQRVMCMVITVPGCCRTMQINWYSWNLTCHSWTTSTDYKYWRKVVVKCQVVTLTKWVTDTVKC